MYIKYNINNFQNNKITIIPKETRYNSELSILTVITKNKHYLKENDVINLNYNYLGLYFNNFYNVFDVKDKEFSLNLSLTNNVILKKDYGNNNTHFVQITNNIKDILYLKPNNFINVYNKEKKELKEELIKDNIGKIIFDLKDNKFYKITTNGYEEYKLIFYFSYKENENEYKIKLTSLGSEFYELAVIENTEEETKLEISFNEDSFYSKSHNIIFDFDNIEITDIHYFNNNINIPLNITNNFGTKLNNEFISELYFTEKKNEIIPDIIDYEKKCFIPYYKDGDEFIPVYGLKFNLYFRDRQNDYENWNSNDTLYWHSWKPGNDVPTNEGDFLGKLGFTDNDVFYQKLKLKKSFLRLSFYNKNDPFKQMLLYYSTIFMDTNDLYGNYIKNIKDKTDEKNERELVNTSALTASFSVYDKFEQTKSSEGFYLYLFPNSIPNEEKTIYMCAEFNHAGYGRTIPFITQYNKETKTAIDFGKNTPFKTYFIDATGSTSLNDYFNHLHIPLTMVYNDKIKEYIYYFNINPSSQNNSSYKLDDNGILTINLYEPKLNKTPE